MKSDDKRPILAKGEEYVDRYVLSSTPQGEDKRPTFEVARKKLKEHVSDTLNIINSFSDEYILNEVIINLKMDIDYSAKSYHPASLINNINAEDVGSKKWIKTNYKLDKKTKVKIEEKKVGKEIFIRINKKDLKSFEQKLEIGNFSKTDETSIRSIDSIYFDTHDNLMNKFTEDWQQGCVEIVLHPFKDDGMVEERFLHLIEKYDVDISKVKIRRYDSGIVFASVVINKKVLKNIIQFNPIRTVHPIRINELPLIREGGNLFSMPLIPSGFNKSSINIGVFDGGIDGNFSYFKNFTVEHNPITTEKSREFIEHGSGVVGAILYGDLSSYKSNEQLKTPIVNVESFRVFPPSDSMDMDLYETIDIIEDVVSRRPDIKVYNLSIGPYGAIDDDNISRFTYALDELSKNGKVLFVTAVGNDGDLGDDDLCRIQAPSDSVNGIGVGAYSKNSNNDYIRAEYSSFGDGREGCKIKPDFLEFGGDLNNPFHLLSPYGKSRNLSCGTSFSAPLVSAKAGEIMGRCNFADPLLVRSILVHSAKHPNGKSDKYMGHGILSSSVDDMLLCSKNIVTTLYQSRLRPTKAVKVHLPFVPNLNLKGNIEITYTIAVSTEVDPRNTEDYTLYSIEDTFYPNINKFSVCKEINGKNKFRKMNIIEQQDEINKLIDDGWTISKNPCSCSSFNNKYKPENERKKNFKWDTIIKRKVNMRYKGLNEPYIVLHAMDRYNSAAEFVNYAVVATIDYGKCIEDAYELTLKKYNKLEVINIRAINELLIK